MQVGLGRTMMLMPGRLRYSYVHWHGGLHVAALSLWTVGTWQRSQQREGGREEGKIKMDLAQIVRGGVSRADSLST